MTTKPPPPVAESLNEGGFTLNSVAASPMSPPQRGPPLSKQRKFGGITHSNKWTTPSAAGHEKSPADSTTVVAPPLPATQFLGNEALESCGDCSNFHAGFVCKAGQDVSFEHISEFKM